MKTTIHRALLALSCAFALFTTTHLQARYELVLPTDGGIIHGMFEPRYVDQTTGMVRHATPEQLPGLLNRGYDLCSADGEVFYLSPPGLKGGMFEWLLGFRTAYKLAKILAKVAQCAGDVATSDAVSGTKHICELGLAVADLTNGMEMFTGLAGSLNAADKLGFSQCLANLGELSKTVTSGDPATIKAIKENADQLLSILDKAKYAFQGFTLTNVLGIATSTQGLMVGGVGLVLVGGIWYIREQNKKICEQNKKIFRQKICRQNKRIATLEQKIDELTPTRDTGNAQAATNGETGSRHSTNPNAGPAHRVMADAGSPPNTEATPAPMEEVEPAALHENSPVYDRDSVIEHINLSASRCRQTFSLAELDGQPGVNCKAKFSATAHATNDDLISISARVNGKAIYKNERDASGNVEPENRRLDQLVREFTLSCSEFNKELRVVTNPLAFNRCTVEMLRDLLLDESGGNLKGCVTQQLENRHQLALSDSASVTTVASSITDGDGPPVAGEAAPPTPAVELHASEAIPPIPEESLKTNLKRVRRAFGHDWADRLDTLRNSKLTDHALASATLDETESSEGIDEI